MFKIMTGTLQQDQQFCGKTWEVASKDATEDHFTITEGAILQHKDH